MESCLIIGAHTEGEKQGGKGTGGPELSHSSGGPNGTEFGLGKDVKKTGKEKTKGSSPGFAT